MSKVLQTYGMSQRSTAARTGQCRSEISEILGNGVRDHNRGVDMLAEEVNQWVRRERVVNGFWDHAPLGVRKRASPGRRTRPDV